MKPFILILTMLSSMIAGMAPTANAAGIESIENIVVIYAENRSFDNLYGSFPGANGLSGVTPEAYTQRDRDGSVLKELPPIWGGLTAKGVEPAVTQAQTEHLANAPFAIDDPKRFNLPLGVTTRDLWHRFYENQMQIAGGKNDRFAAYADSGGLVMGHYASAKLTLWDFARQYVLADNFFMGAFGGSFFNHFALICACAPTYPNADQSPAKGSISAVEADGVTLKPAADMPKSAIEAPPKFVNDGNLTPDFYAVNTMQPPYQPSANGPAPGGNPAYADPAKPNTLPPQTEQTIGDLLSTKGVSRAWYAGAWQVALDGKNADPVPNFQYHHQPFNYFADMAPGTAARPEHLRDGGQSEDLSSSTALVSAEFLFSRRLAGQGDMPALIAPSHADDLTSVLAGITRDADANTPRSGQTQRMAGGTRRALRRLLERVHRGEIDRADAIRELQERIPEWVHAVLAQSLQALLQFRRLYNEDLLRPLELHPEATVDVLAPNLELVADLKRHLTATLLALRSDDRRTRSLDRGTDPAAQEIDLRTRIERDSTALAQVILLNRSAKDDGRKVHYVLVTADKSLFDAYVRWLIAAGQMGSALAP